MNNTTSNVLPGFSYNPTVRVNHVGPDSYFTSLVWNAYINRCPYGGYWNFDYVVDYINDFFSDNYYSSYGINTVDMAIDWIVGGLISDS